MLGLHFVRDKIISSDYKIRVGGDQVGSIYDIASSSSSDGKPSWLRGDVYMTSAPTISDQRKGGCVNLVLTTGREGVQNPKNLADVIPVRPN